MTTYFVSSEIGSDNNAGTSATAPLASLQEAANLVKPGDTVEVMNGTYTAPAGGDALDITTSGTASAPITFEAAPGQTPVIDSSGGWNAINIEASYIVINGFTVVGNAASITLQQALAGSSPGNAEFDGNGIYVTSPGNGLIPNHIVIENNTVSNEPGGGIGVEGADYVQVLNNIVHDNAHWSAYGNSGITVGASQNTDANPGVHMLISGNLVYNNAELVPEYRANAITDGEGIILDTNPGFAGQMLVQNNTVYGNGGPGIESNGTDNAVITDNTVYGNNTQNLQAASNAEIFINQSTNNTVTNNTFAPTGTTPPPGSDTTPPPGSDTTLPAAPAISGDTVSDNVVMLTGTAEAGSIITVFDNSEELGIAPTNSSGAWTFTTGMLPYSSQSFTTTATDVAGNVSPLSSALAVSLNVPLVVNGSFTTGDLSGWTLGGNDGSTQWGPPIFIDTNSEGATPYAVGMGSMGADGTLSQTIATTAGQTYTLSFWLQNEASGTNDFKAVWNGQTLLSLTNAAQSGYTEHTYTVTATSSTTTLEFSAANNPSQWDLDNISLTAAGSTTTAPPAGSTTTTPPAGSTTTDPPASGPNLVANGNFATGDFTDWTLGGNSISSAFGTEIFVDTHAEGSSTYAAELGSVGSDGSISQTLATTPGQTYQLTFWLANGLNGAGASPNDFTAKWNGTSLLSLTNASQQGYTEYTYDVVATGSSTTLEFDARQDPSSWSLDNISVTPVGTTVPAPAVQSGAVNISGTDPTVTLTGIAPDGATVTVSDGGSTPLGATTASSSGAWSFTTPDLPAGNYAFTVTDTTPTGTTTTSNPFDVTVPTPSAGGGASGLPRIAFDPPTTLGSWSNSNQTGSTSSFADIALLGSHIASSFALPSGSYGGTMVNSESTAFGTQPLVANPHHA